MAEIDGPRVCSSILPWPSGGTQPPWDGSTTAAIHGLLSIDHIAVPAAWTVLDIEHHPAFSNGTRISDHDA
jgi:hypothetical protein